MDRDRSAYCICARGKVITCQRRRGYRPVRSTRFVAPSLNIEMNNPPLIGVAWSRHRQSDSDGGFFTITPPLLTSTSCVV